MPVAWALLMLVSFFPSEVTVSQSWGEGLDERRAGQRPVTEYLTPAEVSLKSLLCLQPTRSKGVACLA